MITIKTPLSQNIRIYHKTHISENFNISLNSFMYSVHFWSCFCTNCCINAVWHRWHGTPKSSEWKLYIGLQVTDFDFQMICKMFIEKEDFRPLSNCPGKMLLILSLIQEEGVICSPFPGHICEKLYQVLKSALLDDLHSFLLNITLSHFMKFSSL